MCDKPLISVIVPVYKVEKYLDQCVRSIVEQTYPNLEIILVDDGSPDNCGAMCDAWAEKDDRIRVIHQKNAGAGAARNAGLDAARGEIISMIDSDDYVSAHMYAHLMELMTDDVDIAECQIVCTEKDDCVLADGSEKEVLKVSAEDALRLHILDTKFRQTPPNKLYRIRAIRDIRFPVGNLIDDEFFTYRVIANARNLVSSTACMYAYRQQPESAMHKKFSLQRLQGLEAKCQRLAFLKDAFPNLKEEAKFDLFFSCLFMMQESLRHLQGEDLQLAKFRINNILEQIAPVASASDAGIKKRILMKMAQADFISTCKLLNFLTDIHIIT